jgi:hypothetical protein
MLIQDYRLRTIESTQFKARVAAKQGEVKELLNGIMFPFVGAIDDLHELLAKLAMDMHATINAYTGEFEKIEARGGNPSSGFDPSLHEWHSMNPGVLLPNSPVLLTQIFGVRYKAVGGGWRVCNRARVCPYPLPIFF